MPCTHPLRAFPTGYLTEKGKPELLIVGQADDIIPYWQVSKLLHRSFYRDLTEYFEVPCGKCYECKKAYSFRWSIRCAAEALDHKYIYFLTLTYAQDPGELKKKDLRNFFNKLWKLGYRFRYFACGEYGENYGRSHFHVLLFMYDTPLNLVPWSRSGVYPTFRAPEIESVWLKGFVLVGVADSAAVGKYVAKYILKRSSAPKGKEKPFITMSRKPGLGFSRFEELRDAYGALIVPDGKGKALKGSIPKSYREKMNIPSDPSKMEAIAVKLKNAMIAAGYTAEECERFLKIEIFREQNEYMDALKEVKSKI